MPAACSPFSIHSRWGATPRHTQIVPLVSDSPLVRPLHVGPSLAPLQDELDESMPWRRRLRNGVKWVNPPYGSTCACLGGSAPAGPDSAVNEGGGQVGLCCHPTKVSHTHARWLLNGRSGRRPEHLLGLRHFVICSGTGGRWDTAPFERQIQTRFGRALSNSASGRMGSRPPYILSSLVQISHIGATLTKCGQGAGHLWPGIDDSSSRGRGTHCRLRAAALRGIGPAERLGRCKTRRPCPVAPALARSFVRNRAPSREEGPSGGRRLPVRPRQVCWVWRSASMLGTESGERRCSRLRRGAAPLAPGLWDQLYRRGAPARRGGDHEMMRRPARGRVSRNCIGVQGSEFDDTSCLQLQILANEAGVGAFLSSAGSPSQSGSVPAPH